MYFFAAAAAAGRSRVFTELPEERRRAFLTEEKRRLELAELSRIPEWLDLAAAQFALVVLFYAAFWSLFFMAKPSRWIHIDWDRPLPWLAVAHVVGAVVLCSLGIAAYVQGRSVRLQQARYHRTVDLLLRDPDGQKPYE